MHRLVGETSSRRRRAFIAAAAAAYGLARSLWRGVSAAFYTISGPAAALAYLADVARLEWAVSRAIHAADREPLDLHGSRP